MGPRKNIENIFGCDICKKMYIMILTLKVQNKFLKNPINVDVGTYEIVLNLYISKL